MRAGRGHLVTFEGIEGSGKTTQWRLAAEALRQRGLQVCATREPGGTELGARLRAVLLDPANEGMDPLCELLLYCADRAEHAARVMRPALERGELLLCDRYSDATRAYQGWARGLGEELVRRVDVGRLDAELTLLFDLPAAEGLARARARNSREGSQHEARFEQEELAFHERVRHGYIEIARLEPERVHTLDARLSEDDLSKRVLASILELVEESA